MKWLDLLSRLAQLALGPWVQRLVQDLDRWRWQMFQSCLLLLLAAASGLTVLLLVALLVTLMFWETYRLEALGALALGYAVLTAGMVRRASRLMMPLPGRSSPGQSSGPACGACPACPRSGSGGG